MIIGILRWTAALAMLGMMSSVADGMAQDTWRDYVYSASEVEWAAAADLDVMLAPHRHAGRLDRQTYEYARVQRVFAQVVGVAKRQSTWARDLDWRLYIHEGRFREAYARAGGKLVISMRFLEQFHPSDAQLAFVIGHEVAHVLCEHERMKLSAVWRRNAPQRLPARYAMEFLDTEPWVRAQVEAMARMQERIADRVGLALAVESGAMAEEAASFFDKGDAEGQLALFPDVHDAPMARKALLLQGERSGGWLAALFARRGLDCAP